MITPNHALTGAILYGGIASSLGAPELVVGALGCLGAVVFSVPDVLDAVAAAMKIDTRYRPEGFYNQFHHPEGALYWIEIVTGMALHTIIADPLVHEMNKFAKGSLLWWTQWLAGEAALLLFNYGLFILLR